MPAKSRGKGVEVRRSSRRGKQKTFGSDFEMDPPKKKQRKEDPEPEPEPEPVPPCLSLLLDNQILPQGPVQIQIQGLQRS